MALFKRAPAKAAETTPPAPGENHEKPTLWRRIKRSVGRVFGATGSLADAVETANERLQSPAKCVDARPPLTSPSAGERTQKEPDTQTASSKPRKSAGRQAKSGAAAPEAKRAGVQTDAKGAGARRRRRAPGPLPGRSAGRRSAPKRHCAAEVEGVSIHAVERPAAGGRTRLDRAVVLIHGAGVDHRDWTFSFMDRIDPRWRVLAFDRPGFGASGRTPGAASALPATQARILLKAAAALGVEEAIVVGHSWGGAVAMAWGLAAPRATLGVVSLAGAVAPWSLANAIKNGRRMQSAAMTVFSGGGLRAAAMEAMAESFAPDPMPKGYAEHMDTELDPLSGPTAANMADIATINGALALMTPHYKGFDRPVELVYSDADAILSVDEQGEAARALLPNARLTVLKGAGHMVHQTRPTECLAALERLIAATRTSLHPKT